MRQGWYGDGYDETQNLSQMRCETTSSVEECAPRARSTHGVHHANVEVNIVIGVVLGEVLVARVVVLLVVDAVIGFTLGLIAHVVIVVFVVAIFIECSCLGDILFTRMPRPYPVNETSRRGQNALDDDKTFLPRLILERTNLRPQRNPSGYRWTRLLNAKKKIQSPFFIRQKTHKINNAERIHRRVGDLERQRVQSVARTRVRLLRFFSSQTYQVSTFQRKSNGPFSVR